VLKNFPNQLANLDKLTAALSVADDLLGAGGSLAGNATDFGDQLNDAEVLGGTPISNAASARGLRNFFTQAGLITPGPHWSNVTQLGSDLIASADIPTRNAFWRVAMLQLELDGSHPYRILLRLIADRPGIETYKLLLALEAADDSETEYARVLGLTDLSRVELLAQLDISDQQAANAIKVIPRIALQIGDIRRTENHNNFLVNAPPAATEASFSTSWENFEKSEITTPVAVDASEIAPIPDFTGVVPIAGDLASAVAIRQHRTIIHQRSTASIAHVLQGAGYALFRHPYDCLAFKSGTGSVLIEVKTLDGSRSDERLQTEKALGQLRGYKFFNVLAAMKAPEIIEIIAYSSRPSPNTISFLNENTVHAAWQQDDVWYVANLAGQVTVLSVDDLFGQ
jgi:hypothetical protein